MEYDSRLRVVSEPRESGSRADRGDRASQTVLVCCAGGHTCAISLHDVIETMRPLPLEAFREGTALVAGVSIIRGAPVPVVDLGRILSVAESVAPTRFVTLRVGTRTVALAVESVLGVRTVEAGAFQALPPLLRDGDDEFVSQMGTRDRELVLVLSLGRLLPESTWQALSQSGDAA